MKNNRTKGFTLIELLVYTAIVAFVLIAVVAALQSVYQFYRELTIAPRADRVGISIAERIVRDIRTGEDIVLESSTFGTALGTLTVSVPTEVGTVVKHVAAQNNAIEYWEDAESAEALTPSDMTVSRFWLTHVTTPNSEGVRFELELTYETRDGMQTREYSGFAILRRSYE